MTTNNQPEGSRAPSGTDGIPIQGHDNARFLKRPKAESQPSGDITPKLHHPYSYIVTSLNLKTTFLYSKMYNQAQVKRT